jgi:hypothetical protein
MELNEKSLTALNKAKESLIENEKKMTTDLENNYVGRVGKAWIEPSNFAGEVRGRSSAPSPSMPSATGGGKPENVGGGKPEGVGGGKPEGKGKPELTGLALASQKSGKDLVSKLTELGAYKPIPSNVPMEVDYKLAEKGLMRGKGAAKFIRNRIKRKVIEDSFLSWFGGGDKNDVSSMSFEDAMNSYDSGVKSGSLNTDGTKRTFFDQIGGVQGVLGLLGGLTGKGQQQQQPVIIREEKKDNTLTYVAVGGLVLIVIGVIVYMATKK